jgi:outer membrane protein OmpA-like peptidoglycan-associated protein
MKLTKTLLLSITMFSLFLASCSTWNKSQKGAAIGGAGGAVVGGVIGKVAGNTALGAIIGASVGGAAGAIIGRNMDKQAEEIKNDIPNAKVERVGEGIVVEFNNNVLFGFDRSDISGAAATTLNDLTTILNKYPDTNIEIQGHTDSKGTDEYNMSLSQRRASAVASYLSGRGIASSRVTTKGFGESVPKYSNDTEAGMAQNRRVEFLISANDKMKADAKAQAGQ